MKQFFVASCTMLLAYLLGAQSSTPFTPVAEAQALANISNETELPLSEYQTLVLNLASLQSTLQAAPVEFTTATSAAPVLALPLQGAATFRDYRVLESSVMAPALQARWPQLRTYRLFALDDPTHTGRLTVTPHGCTAVYRTMEGDTYLEPYAWGQEEYHVVYGAEDIALDPAILPPASCGYVPTEAELEAAPLTTQIPAEVSFRGGGQAAVIRNYMLALTCTGEYAQQKGGTVESVLASFVTAANLANETFEREVGVRVTLIDRIENIIFLDPNSDPFQNADEGRALLSQVQNAIIGAGGIPLATYDMGHVFTSGCTDVGGVVGGGARVCGGGKNEAVTCHYSNSLTQIVNRVMTHEVAHHFSVSHSWNNCPGNDGQRAGNAAFEPGSGSTIMSYAGSCGQANNLPTFGASYYHGYSLEQFMYFTREVGGATCPNLIETGNSEPLIELPYTDGFYIPIETPFELEAIATDVDGDELLYCWEQLDLGPPAPLGDPVGDGPAFRSFPPRAAANRVFPNWDDLLANRRDISEVLPSYSRDLSFRCTVRDYNEEVGATVWEDVAFEATASAGPFRVLSPNTSTADWSVGSYQEVRWDVANTDNELVNCQQVNILLSTDGGRNYEMVLVEGAPNIGSAYVTVPDAVGSNARIRVQAANNIFFDVSNENFRISPAATPSYTLDFSPQVQELCLPTSATIDFNSSPILGYDSLVTLSVFSELPQGTVATFSAPDIVPGEASTLLLDFTAVENVDGRFPVTIQAIAPEQDTFYRTFLVDLVDNDFAELQLLTPDNGTAGITFGSEFSWTELPNALEYDWRISADPTFTEVFEAKEAIEADSVSSSRFFVENTLYYWQVRPRNECGNGDWSLPSVLHTSFQDCDRIASDNVPLNIPGVGPLPTVRSELYVDQSGTISDINLPLVDIRYNPIQSFDIDIISPAGTRVALYEGNCFSSDRVWIGFDDDAPDELICPPNEGIVFQPQEPLSAFEGENTQGIWTLEVKVNERGFGSGTIREWSLEFCAELTPSQPSLLVNNPLEVPPAQANPITRELLEISDPDQQADELYFTVVAVPANGQLEFLGQALEVGDQFQQRTINAGNLFYRHNGSETTEDGFYFVVQDGTGGFLPVERFEIQIDENAPVSTEDLTKATDFILFPNPASTWVTLRLTEASTQDLPLSIYNAAGQRVWQAVLATGTHQQQISTRDWPTGIYYLRAGGVVRKLVVE